MTQLVPATCVLGPGMTGLTIGLRVLNLDGTEYAAFSTTSVAETSTAGTYRKAGGVVAPLAGGYIVWGTALVDYAEAAVKSTAVNVTMQQGVAVAAADANGNVPVVLTQVRPTFYVSSVGNDENDGKTTATAFATLTVAQAAAAAGDLIHVFPGTYTDHKLGKNGVDWYFERGVTIQVTAAEDDDYIFGDGASTVVYTVSGHARLIIDGPSYQYSYVHAIRVVDPSSYLYIQCETIVAQEWEASANGIYAINGAKVTAVVENDVDVSSGNYCAFTRYGSTVRLTAQRLLGGNEKTAYSRDAGSHIILNGYELIHTGQGGAIEVIDGADISVWVRNIYCTRGYPVVAAVGGNIRVWEANIYASNGCMAITNGVIDLINCLNPSADDTIETGGVVNRIVNLNDQGIRDAMKLAPSAGAPAAGSVDAKLDDILTTIGSEIVEGTYTRDDILRIIAAALAGKTSGSGTATVEILGLDGATTRIIASVDGVGNRTAMTLDGAA
jgi:hypothetical protein